MSINWSEELEGTQCHDQRILSNLIKIYECKAADPELSFSASLGEALRKSSYRIFSNEKTLVQSGHQKSCLARCIHYDYVLISEDTTDLNYRNHTSKEGLGDLGGGKRTLGLCLHSGLAISPSGLPLGILSQYLWAPQVKRRTKNELKSLPIEQKEPYKWIKQLQSCTELFISEQTKGILIADREGDFYEHFLNKQTTPMELLVRAREKYRYIYYQDERIQLKDLASKLEVLDSYSIQIPRQKGQPARDALISLKVAKIVMPPPYAFRQNDSIAMYVVIAQELDPPDDQQAVEWILYTSLNPEMMQTASLKEFASLMVYFYKLRWLVERFHYILKQGLKVEKIQYDNFQRIKSALEVSSVIAWYILYLKELAKSKAEQPAKKYFSSKEILLLTLFTKASIENVKDYILALAKLIKFKPTKKQPLPGEKTLWLACQKFLNMKEAIDIFEKDVGQE